LDVNAGEDIITINYDTTLNAVPPAVGYAYWQKAGGTKTVTFADSTLYNTPIYLEGEGEYLLKWVAVNGVCSSVSDSLKLVVESTTFYEGFSPDGNEINDTYEIIFTKGVSGTLTIFNRNGLQIKEIPGETPIKWDGTSENGTQVPDDTYFYIFVRNDGVSARKGYIELRRQRQ
jgi:gliding motility-associated-like protein